jgi:hypothetical protein
MKLMTKAWFCLAVATIAAVIADFFLESASDNGWFGPGDYTDHSNWVIGPALLVGLMFTALHLCLRTREALTREHWSAQNWRQLASVTKGSRVLSFTPMIYAIQLLTLFVMERVEQIVVYGHALPGMVWLDGPVIVSLAVHAAVCCIVAVVAAWFVGVLAHATLRLVRLVRTFATVRMRRLSSRYFHYRPAPAFGRAVRALCRIGERAPPRFLLT